MKHNLQKLDETQRRFVGNKLVEFLYETSKYSMAELLLMNFDDDDWSQFHMLTSHTVSYWESQPQVSDEYIDLLNKEDK